MSLIGYRGDYRIGGINYRDKKKSINISDSPYGQGKNILQGYAPPDIL